MKLELKWVSYHKSRGFVLVTDLLLIVLKEPAENPTGCIRSEPYESRKPFDIFSFLMSQYRQMPNSSESKNDVEMVHKSARFVRKHELKSSFTFPYLKGKIGKISLGNRRVRNVYKKKKFFEHVSF